jgi:hypothetical protein
VDASDEPEQPKETAKKPARKKVSRKRTARSKKAAETRKRNKEERCLALHEEARVKREAELLVPV